MYIVIDSNTLSKVFNVKDKEHVQFAPVQAWIDDRRGLAVFGGTKYKEELKDAGRLRFLRLMKDDGRAVAIKDTAVDELEREVKK